jgi:hypothetical protein
MWLIVALVGLPSAWRNPTAAALVLSWSASEVWFLLTGDNLRLQFYVFPDSVVLAIILAKPEYNPCEFYRGTLHQLACVVTERTPPDRIVMAIFPVMWMVYVSDLDAYHKWWLLYLLVVAQFAAAGLEALSPYRRASAVSETSAQADDVFRRLAWEKSGDG